MFLVHRERSERRDGGTHYLESLKKNTEITIKIVKKSAARPYAKARKREKSEVAYASS